MKLRYMALVILIVALFPGPVAALCEGVASAILHTTTTAIDANGGSAHG